MRLMREFPQIEVHVNQGELNVTLMGMTQSLFNQEKNAGRTLSVEQKTEVIEQIRGCTKREAEQIIQSHSPEPKVPREHDKPIGKNKVDRRVILSKETNEKLEKLKRLHAHKKFTNGELIDYLCDLGLQEIEKKPAKPKSGSKAAAEREVWERDGRCCTNCGSDFAVEIDHKIPKSMGGEDTLENLRLLCRSCNQRSAIEQLGQRKMDPFINRM
jgi:hypothetical protein